MVMEEIEPTLADVSELRRIDVNNASELGRRVSIGGATYTIADIKTIRCVAVEGALPHIVSADFARISIDLRTSDKQVVTWQDDKLGHSLWQGAYYRLADLDPSGLRTFEHWSRPNFEVAG